MERVAFLIEDRERQSTGTRISCLLNPNTLVFRRMAGLRARTSLYGPLTQEALPDDPLLQTGGGSTELCMDLLFDVNLPHTAFDGQRRTEGEEPVDHDVRDVTRPLWRLAENQEAPGQVPGPPRVRFVWGKAWDFPAVVAAIAERFESFSPQGVPKRSFVRLRLLRADDPTDVHESVTPGASLEAPPEPAVETDLASPLDPVPTGEEAAPASYEIYVSPGHPLFITAFHLYGDAAAWIKLAESNPGVDPLAVSPGTVLNVPAFDAGPKRAIA